MFEGSMKHAPAFACLEQRTAEELIKDYDPFLTSSPVMRFETFRYLGAKAAAMKRPLRSSDAVMAYCNAQLPPDRHQPARMPKSHRSRTARTTRSTAWNSAC